MPIDSKEPREYRVYLDITPAHLQDLEALSKRYSGEAQSLVVGILMAMRTEDQQRPVLFTLQNGWEISNPAYRKIVGGQHALEALKKHSEPKVGPAGKVVLDMVEIKPGIFGVHVNINKFIEWIIIQLKKDS